MIYPEDYKCLTCKFRYYGCKHRQEFGRNLACIAFERRQAPKKKMANLALCRCLFAVCPVVLSRKLHN